MKTLYQIFIIICLFILTSAQVKAVEFKITRLNNGQPIINEQMFRDVGAASEGQDINGPSVIRVPSWIPPEHRADPEAVYYLYFANHTGKYIRMAWAKDIEGPWHLYHIGSRFRAGERGVLDLGSSGFQLENGITIPDNHIASPDVHKDYFNKQIILYFHSGSTIKVNGKSVSGQKTFVATSPYGLNFRNGIKPVILGPSYFRVFQYDNQLYALTNGGTPYRAPDPANPWTPPANYDYSKSFWQQHPDNPFQRDIANAGISKDKLRVRHTAVRIEDETLQVFYSRRGDAPERIQMSTIDMSVGDWQLWDATYPPIELIKPEPGWEGGELPIAPSETGAAPENVNQLRDPYVFEDNDGSLYLFYAGRGEDAIGVALLEERSSGISVAKGKNYPFDFQLMQNYPNPFNSSTTISFELGQSAKVSLEIFSVSGGLIENLAQAHLSAGGYKFRWQPGNIPSGTYFCQLTADGRKKVIKITYLK